MSKKKSMRDSQIIQKTLLIFTGIFSIVIGLFLTSGVATSIIKDGEKGDTLELVLSSGLIVFGIFCFVFAKKIKK